MPSLRHLLAAHPPLLLIDAASVRVQVGVLNSESQQRWESSTEEAGVGVFRCLEQLGVRPGECGAWIFCDGPGSVLGIRTVAMALRTWAVAERRPIYRYCSLALVAHALGRAKVGVIADARREAWHLYQLGGTLRRSTAADLPGELAMPEGFRHWTKPPAGTIPVPYSVDDRLRQVPDADLFQPTTEPDAFLHEEPSYVTWVPQIHRAPTAKT